MSSLPYMLGRKKETVERIGSRESGPRRWDDRRRLKSRVSEYAKDIGIDEELAEQYASEIETLARICPEEAKAAIDGLQTLGLNLAVENQYEDQYQEQIDEAIKEKDLSRLEVLLEGRESTPISGTESMHGLNAARQIERMFVEGETSRLNSYWNKLEKMRKV